MEIVVVPQAHPEGSAPCCAAEAFPPTLLLEQAHHCLARLAYR